VQARLPVPDPYRAAANRGTAALALGLLGDFSKPAIADLGKALNDQSGFVASQAAEVLRGFGPVAREALPMAMTALCATNQMIADTAWRVVSSIGRDTPDLPPQLVKMLENDDVVKIRVLRILAALGSIAAPCQSDIERLVTATNVNVRFAAVAALWDIVPARQIELLPRLEEFIACNDEQLRTLTANKVVQVQPMTKEAVELLAIGIHTSNPEVVHNGNDIFCWGVLSALAKRGREATNAIPVMVLGLTAANPRVAAKAAEALGNVAGPDKEVLDALKQAQHHEELMVRDAANAAIQKIQSRLD
jgi:HEAT repeat protein